MRNRGSELIWLTGEANGRTDERTEWIEGPRHSVALLGRYLVEGTHMAWTSARSRKLDGISNIGLATPLTHAYLCGRARSRRMV